jgi:hypothetical protein
MKRVFTLFSMFLIIQAFTTSIASAQYYQANDINLNVSAPISVPNLNTGALTFGSQEQVHQILYGTSGTSIDHSYIWININGQPVVAIDPPKAMVRG